MDILFQAIESQIRLQSHTKDALHRLGIFSNIDLLLHKPHSYITRNTTPNLSRLKSGERIIAEVTIREIVLPKKRGTPTKIYADNATGDITLVFFNKIPAWIFNTLRVGAKKTIEGKVEWNDFYYQISHPDFIVDSSRAYGIEPVYPLTYGLHNKQLHGYILRVLEAVEGINNLHAKILPILSSLRHIHSPVDLSEIDKHNRILAYYELLSNQLSLAFIRQNNKTERGRAFSKAEAMQRQVLDNLGFELSQGQKDVIKEIEDEQISPTRMSQMLQGDVGSGKTLVALMTMLNAANKGVQSALMAPTDLLSNQHFLFFEKALQNMNIPIALLTGKTKARERREILEKLASGEILILIGTHALFQTQVIFKDLGYIIIDEQHKFGVKQRMELLGKAEHPDLLVMTATPIPRSLTMTAFGDMSVSKLTAKPTSRPEIITLLKSRSKMGEVIESLRRKVESHEQVYWVCPAIEQAEDTESSIHDVVTRFNALNEIFPGKVGLIHGKLAPDDKDSVMQGFKAGEMQILVATTVIEVGIDVPNATLMVVENAERFGLAQLHQLRGRVGRGDLQSYCILLYEYLAGMVKTRLEVMRSSNDGFYIAEQDLLLRGGGEVLGTKQSGQIEFKFADLARDTDLLIKCHDIAKSKSDNDGDNQWIIRLFNNDFAELDPRA
ncbi:MAG: ATP-dependent DNA helicase RecG [Pseudomonadota bacterium]